MVKSLNGGIAVHTVLTEVDDQKLFSHAVALIKSTASYILKLFYFFTSIIKDFPISKMKL